MTMYSNAAVNIGVHELEFSISAVNKPLESVAQKFVAQMACSSNVYRRRPRAVARRRRRRRRSYIVADPPTRRR